MTVVALFTRTFLQGLYTQEQLPNQFISVSKLVILQCLILFLKLVLGVLLYTLVAYRAAGDPCSSET